MGSWFSNMHIRKNNAISVHMISEYINKTMAAQQYLSATSETDADVAFAIVSSVDAQWFSVYSDMFSFDNPKSFENYAIPASKELGSDVLGISCFDSDYLYLNLINANEMVNAWAGVGRATGLGILKRTNLSAWKKRVQDFPRFKASIQKKYIFAEEALMEIEQCIQLPQVQSMASYEYLAEEGLGESATYLYFKLPETMKSQELPKLEQRTSSLMPCYLDKPSTVSGLNVGGASKGLSVYFIGPYVEHDEITFSDVCFVKWKNNQVEPVPFELKKVQLSDGQWAYHYHDPGYRIPPKMDDRLPMSKRMRVEHERSIIVRFVPHGNSRKILDITVVLVPDKNPEGQTSWNVWHRFGSKQAFVKFHNDNWGKHPNCEHLLLKEADFD